jgi:hypothetical protein
MRHFSQMQWIQLPRLDADLGICEDGNAASTSLPASAGPSLPGVPEGPAAQIQLTGPTANHHDALGTAPQTKAVVVQALGLPLAVASHGLGEPAFQCRRGCQDTGVLQRRVSLAPRGRGAAGKLKVQRLRRHRAGGDGTRRGL